MKVASGVAILVAVTLFSGLVVLPQPAQAAKCDWFCSICGVVIPCGQAALSRCVDCKDTIAQPQPASCGDGACNGRETCSSCPGDCGACPPTTPSCTPGSACSGCPAGGYCGGTPTCVYAGDCSCVKNCWGDAPDSGGACGYYACPAGTQGAGTVYCDSSQASGVCGPKVCTPNWDCPAWSTVSCAFGTQTRTCIDRNGCINPRTETQSCTCSPAATCISGCNDNNACTTDTCNVAANGCSASCTRTPISCTTPPKPYCSGNNILVSFPYSGENPGFCDTGEGGCQYPPIYTNCPNGCSNGQCNTCSAGQTWDPVEKKCIATACTPGEVLCNGVCVARACATKNCNDGNVCTTDRCVESGDGCSATCEKTPVTCPVPNACNVGYCVPPPFGSGCSYFPKNCDDNNACTTDGCNLGTGACVNVNVPVNGGWRWGDWTDSSACVNGKKTQTLTGTCDNPAPACNGNQCSGTSPQTRTIDCTCSPAATCTGGCNDNNACTADTCNVAANGCSASCSNPVDPAKVVNGGWRWSDWRDSSACVNGKKTQTRTTTTCDNPAPACGGAQCSSTPPETRTIDCTPACQPDWQCSGWSYPNGYSDGRGGTCSLACGGGTQTRRCTDANNCGTNAGKPAESQSCNTQACPVCQPSWQCSGWSYPNGYSDGRGGTCSLACGGGTQTRACTDSNGCGTSEGMPPLSQSCNTPACPRCGDGAVNQASEQCDAGANNGKICSPAYGGTCTYCTAACLQQTVQGQYCGDGSVNGPEECDSANLNGNTCESFGYSVGTLKCSAAGTANQCSFDKSSCAGITGPSEVCTGTDASIVATAASLSGLQKIEIYVDNTVKQTCASSPCTYTAQYSGGGHEYFAKLYNTAGTLQTPTKTITADSAAPLTTVSSEPAKAYTTDFVKINAAASDTGGVAKIEVFADGASKAICSNQVTCAYSQQYAGGTHNFYAVATDKCGNTKRADGAFYANSEPAMQPIQEVPSCDFGETITLRCPASDADNDITAVNVWAGECRGSCANQNDAAWNTPETTDKIYHQGAAMSGSGNGVYTQTLTVNQAIGTKIAATCQATDANGRKSQVWGDRYPLCTVGGCTTPPSFSNIQATPNPAGTGAVTVAFRSSRDLQGNPSVNVTPGAETGATQQLTAQFVSKSGNDYTYRFDVQGSQQSGRSDITIRGADTTGCAGGGLAGSFCIDTAAPATTIKCNGGSCGQAFTDNVNILFSATDASGSCGAGVKEILSSVDGGAETAIAGAEGGIAVSGHGTHTVTYRARDNLGNLEAVKSASVDINTIPTQGRMDVKIQMEKTSLKIGEKAKVKIIGRLLDKNTNKELARCAFRDNHKNDPKYKKCTITRLRIDEGTPKESDLLPGYDDSNTANYDSDSDAWKIDIDTLRYRSTLTGCLQGQGQQNCSSGSFSVVPAIVDINVKYPDVDAQIVPVTPAGTPNFTRSMQVKFVAAGRGSDGISQDCTGTDCAAFYDIKPPGDAPDYSNKQIFWDGFAGGYKGEAASTSLQCNTAYNVWIKMTIQNGPLAGTTGEKSSGIFVNCIPTVTAGPVEARTTLGAKNLQIFTVTFWNPKNAMNNMKIEMESPTTPQVLAWINFAGDGDSRTFSAPALSPTTFTVEMPVAARAGKYPIDFTVTNLDTQEQYRNTGTLFIFAEGLPEFQAWQLLILIAIAPLVLWKTNFFEPGKARKRK